MNIEFVNFRFDLNLQLIDRLHYGWVSFLEKLNVAATVLAVDNALWAYRWHIAIEAEVLDFFFRVLSTHLTDLSE